MIYGYARCSTRDKQDIERQVRDLTVLGATKIFRECISGVNAKRPQLELVLENVQSGDTIVTTEVSRLARSVHQLCHIIELAKTRQIRLMCGALVLDFRSQNVDSMSVAMYHMMGVFAELERGITIERINSGLANAKSNGKQIGRPATTKADVPHQVVALLPQYVSGELTKSEFARLAGVSRPTLYNYLKVLGVLDVRRGQNKLTSTDIPAIVLQLLPEYRAGNIKKQEFATLAGVSRPTLDKYLALLNLDTQG
jgi:DNA invertase Pin-like site-specific DNA recombinase